MLFIAHLTQIKQMIAMEQFLIVKLESNGLGRSTTNLSLEGSIVLYSSSEEVTEGQTDVVQLNRKLSTASLEVKQ